MSFERHRQRLLELLRDYAYQRRTVTLASGKTSNFYIDTKQVTLTAEGHFLIGQCMRHEIDRLAPEVVAIGGMTMGADPLASATSLTSYLAGRPLDAFYVRKQPKGHGTGQWIEGATRLPPNAPVAVLEDVVTTGGSTLAAIERVRAAGFDVRVVIAVVDRQEGGRAAIAAQAPFASLFSRQDFPA
ncbi:MAG: orotate phosphoribosyltransferase [Deltaproteobacteria bacterium]|nr:MAG: orotate phosphoribosyltransferase [Deltaproteobacteria bacterium]